MNTVNQYSDNPERVSSEGEAPSDIQPKPRDPDAERDDIYGHDLELDADAVMELARDRTEQRLAKQEQLRNAMAYVYKQSAAMQPPMADEDDSIFGLVGAMKANADLINQLNSKGN